jgi:UDP-glucuronate 4-epimerase
MRFLVTGAAGFIGFHLARRLLTDGHVVAGVDGLTPYYDVTLKRGRLAILQNHENFSSHILMLEDMAALSAAARAAKPDVIIHLAAQAGVRYSLENPRAYVDSNLTGTFNVMEMAHELGVRHLLYASTSSVYGANAAIPFRETDRADHPLTLYAATKKAGEEMTHAYAHLWKIPTTAFRFFTVYGPWGRPDMAPYKFVTAARAGQPIDVYGQGQMRRDFTYIDDLIEAVARLVDCTPVEGKAVGPQDSLSPVAPWRVVNIGGGQPVGLLDFIAAFERALGAPIQRNMLPMQKGDVPVTYAAPDLLAALTGYTPATSLDDGVAAFVDWHRGHYP